ncbi:hypothetical protein EDD76_103165 [Kineothrix alysoides]|uniref:Uncharacterized protein n=1 Tax=Kineothrix alysoides TaxID=1469948 RepID=A0A4R1R3H3_9FIRM|nr:hypothetical protein [Kineothrix alysoides]TCL59974.1 hypothetical protein EDD76_103165 [Kineothrix alysoides]
MGIEEIGKILSLGIVIGIGLGFIPIIIGIAIRGILSLFDKAI